MPTSVRTETVSWPTLVQLERRITATDGTTEVLTWADIPLGGAVQDAETGFYKYKLNFTLDTTQAGFFEVREKATPTKFEEKPIGPVASSAGGGGGATAAEIWAYAARTLTSGNVVRVVDPQKGEKEIVKGDGYTSATTPP